ncbi:MAG: hypothetical protein K0Q79_1297 [Flavipsychrobacter sp.]|jgi:hypothetical protein|nr:hypothetical protein [Flavipsychrobacter sp.]
MNIFSSIVDKIKRSVEVHINLLKVNIIGRTASVASYLMFGMIMLFILFGVILFLGLGLSEAFVAMGLTHLAAYFLTMVVYILLLLIIFSCRKSITKFFSGSLIKIMTEDEDDDESEKE